MFKEILTLCRPAIFLFVLLCIITGILYPAVITGLAQALFADQANGSIMPQGSMLIGQSFTDNNYFWGRPSATTPTPYNAASSTASNLGPTNPATVQALQARIAVLKKADPQNKALIPADLVMASGSGLDPEISPEAAFYQVDRVATARHLSPQVVHQLVLQHIQGRTFGIFGEPRVNVLSLNVALDKVAQKAP